MSVFDWPWVRHSVGAWSPELDRGFCLQWVWYAKQNFALNEVTRANLQGNKRILKWRPFWNKEYWAEKRMCCVKNENISSHAHKTFGAQLAPQSSFYGSFPDKSFGTSRNICKGIYQFIPFLPVQCCLSQWSCHCSFITLFSGGREGCLFWYAIVPQIPCQRIVVLSDPGVLRTFVVDCKLVRFKV